MGRTEIRSLTGLRGLASLYVALYHYRLFIPAIFENRRVHAFEMHGYLSVDVFFILSAFVLSLSNPFKDTISTAGYKKFMLKRWIRIYPSYFIMVLTGYFLVYTFPIRLANLALTLTLFNLLFNSSVLFLHLWSLGAEWIAYFLFPFLSVVVEKTKSKGKNAVLFLSGICFYILSIYTSEKKITNDYSLDVYQGYPALFRCFAGYLFGMLSINIYRSGWRAFFQNEKALYTLIMLLGLLLLFPKADMLIVVLFIPVMVGIAQKNTIVSTVLHSKPVYFLGKISYPLYLIHYIILLKIDSIVPMLLRLHINSFSVLLYFSIVILLAAFFTYYVEKPFVTYLSGKWINPASISV